MARHASSSEVRRLSHQQFFYARGLRKHLGQFQLAPKTNHWPSLSMKEFPYSFWCFAKQQSGHEKWRVCWRQILEHVGMLFLFRAKDTSLRLGGTTKSPSSLGLEYSPILVEEFKVTLDTATLPSRFSGTSKANTVLALSQSTLGISTSFRGLKRSLGLWPVIRLKSSVFPLQIGIHIQGSAFE